MPTFTRQEVRETLIDQYGIGRHGTNTGVSASSIQDDANFGGHGAAEGIDVGSQVLITSGTRDGDIAQLSSKPKLSTGLMNVDPSFGGALANGDTFALLYPRFRFDGGGFSVHHKINQALAQYRWERRLVPITLVADGDMLKSGVTDWTDVGVTSSKSAAGFPLGLRILVCAASGPSNAYTKGDLIAVDEDETYFFQAVGLIGLTSSAPATVSGKIILYDLTNGADIDLDEETIDRTEPLILTNTAVTLPSGCRSVSVRLNLTSGTGTTIVAFADVILRRNSAREFTIQDREIRVLDIGRVFVTTENDWAERGKTMQEVEATVQQVGGGLWQIRTRQSLAGKSVWYEEFVKPSALISDSDTTTIPKEDLAAVAAELLLEPLRRDKRWVGWYERAARDAARARMDYASLSVVRTETQRVYPLVRT